MGFALFLFIVVIIMVFLGPVIWFIIVRHMGTAYDREHYKTCPFCQKRISKKATVCPYCTRKVDIS